ncbi:hypothetical protein [Streptococcus suis]|nr:hypothetical protein [Streptococcus suis]QZS50408.1 hypothetical protein K6976_06150 [Streptococcus suis]QZT22539.1 hypothetical protein K6975_05265 [Streptococcus suis]HEM3522533.1 hypothetical protein [Streptococcus suis]HEM3523064.1 hypothetical protein [Streptococcus suis]
MSSDESNTRNSFIAIDKLLNKEVKKYFPKDHQILRNTVVQYYRKGGDLDYDDMVEAIFESYSPIQESFTDDIKNDLVKKLRELPTKKSGGFDTHFKAITSVLKVRIKNILPLRSGMDLVITDGIDNIQDVIQAKEDPTFGKILIISIEDSTTFDSFKNPKKVHENNT